MVRSLNKHKLRHRQSERRGDSTNPTATTIVRASSPRDFNAAGRSWRANVSGWRDSWAETSPPTSPPPCVRWPSSSASTSLRMAGFWWPWLGGNRPASSACTGGVLASASSSACTSLPKLADLASVGLLRKVPLRPPASSALTSFAWRPTLATCPVAVKIYRKLGFREIEPYSTRSWRSTDC
jgi:hypothetical protein